VGTASLRAIPFVLRLHEAGFRVWPFAGAALDAKKPKPLLIEMYARLLTGAVKKSNVEARAAYLKKKMREDEFYSGLARSVVKEAVASDDVFDALVSAMEMARHREQFVRLKRTRDKVRRLEGITWVPGIR
jgi:hypothetical protein